MAILIKYLCNSIICTDEWKTYRLYGIILTLICNSMLLHCLKSGFFLFHSVLSDWYRVLISSKEDIMLSAVWTLWSVVLQKHKIEDIIYIVRYGFVKINISTVNSRWTTRITGQWTKIRKLTKRATIKWEIELLVTVTRVR